MRAPGTTVDFDLALAKKQAADNPVFYVQYGHARISSILSRASKEGYVIDGSTEVNLHLLNKAEEVELIKTLLAWPEVVAGAAHALEPHRLVFALEAAVAAFHHYYTRGKVDSEYRVITDDTGLTQARLVLCRAVQLMLKQGLGLLGVTAPEWMTSSVAEDIVGAS